MLSPMSLQDSILTEFILKQRSTEADEGCNFQPEAVKGQGEEWSWETRTLTLRLLASRLRVVACLATGVLPDLAGPAHCCIYSVSCSRNRSPLQSLPD